jgi:hypothetical protein
MEYSIKTSTGVMERTKYSSTKERPIYGNGQGACDSCMQWGLISITLTKAMNPKAVGFVMTDPRGALKVKRTIQVFVDDSDKYVNGASKEIDKDELIERIRHDSQLWADLLHASGGKLELTKRFFTMVVWRFDEWGQTQTTQANDLGNISIRLAQGEEEAELEMHKCTDGYKTL